MKSGQFNKLVLGRIARAIGVSGILLPAFYACGGTTIIDGAGGAGGTSTDASSAETSTTDATSTADSTSVTAVTATTGGGCTESTTSGGANLLHYSLCLDDLPQPCPNDSNAAAAVISQVLAENCCADGLTCESLSEVICGPYATQGDSCCFEIETFEDGCAVPGRPYVVDDAPRLASVQQRIDWLGNNEPSFDGLTADERATLCTLWTQHALAEHASVASFARFALELMAVGAPAHLVEDTHRAAMDEVEHARLAFGISSAFADDDRGPGVFPLGQQQPMPSLLELAVATVHEGCVNETLSALLLSVQRDEAGHPAIAETLDQMVRDELMHVDLAWRTVKWAIEAGGEEVANAVRDAFASTQRPTIAAFELKGHALMLSPVPMAEDAERLMEVALKDVVMPAAAALFETVRKQPAAAVSMPAS